MKSRCKIDTNLKYLCLIAIYDKLNKQSHFLHEKNACQNTEFQVLI